MDKLILTDPETDLECLAQLERYAKLLELMSDTIAIKCMENAGRAMDKMILEELRRE